MLERLSGNDVFFPAAGAIWGLDVSDHGLANGTLWAVFHLVLFYFTLWLLGKTIGGEYGRL